MPSKAILLMKELFETKQIIPSCPCSLSVAQRKNLTKEGGKGSNKGFILGVLVFDTLQETLCEIRNTLLEVLYRMLKGSDVWFSVVKESVKDIGEFFGLLQVYFKDLLIVLIENGSTCVLKDS